MHRQNALRLLLVRGALVALGACRTGPHGAPSVAPASHTVFQTDSALLRLGGRSLWPGFDPRDAPVAYYDGERTVLFRHPHPPAGFVPVSGQSFVSERMGRDASVTANSSTAVDGIMTATVMLNGAPRSSADDEASLAIHELFHVYQRSRHPAWIANEATLFTYPMDDARALAMRRAETAALRVALAESSDDRARCWGRGFVNERRSRYALIGAEAAAYERGTELNEGLAQYVERRSVGKPSNLPAEDFPVERIRERAYATGEAIARLLDRFNPSWRNVLSDAPLKDVLPLDSLLGEAIGPIGESPVCSVAASERPALYSAAVAEVSALSARRQRTRAAFLARTGARVTVEAGSNALFPEGFDPLNVERLTSTEILHTRFVRLGNASGAVEVLGVPALTTAGGSSHPLFAGVRRLVVAGLTRLPVVRDSAGTLLVEGGGLSAHFRGAKAETAGDTLVIRLP